MGLHHGAFRHFNNKGSQIYNKIQVPAISYLLLLGKLFDFTSMPDGFKTIFLR